MGWMQLLIAACGAVAGYWVKIYLDRRKAVEARMFVDKRVQYRNLLLCLKHLQEGGIKSQRTSVV